MNYAYVTLLSTNQYLLGVLAMFESLKRTNPNVKEFIVIINEEITVNNIQILKSFGYKVIQKNKIRVTTKNQNNLYWLNTFDKFHVFELTEYNKIIYLDSDLYILQNIDELFTKPNLSGVIAGKEIAPNWEGINSGLMVIEPKEGIVNQLIDFMQTKKYEKEIGDQDIINDYFEWPKKNLALKEGYNIFAEYLDFYIKEKNYPISDIYVIHYIGSRKPWMLSEQEQYQKLEEYHKNNKLYQYKTYQEYLEILKEIKKRVGMK